MSTETIEQLAEERSWFRRIYENSDLQSLLFLLPTFTLLSLVLFIPLFTDGFRLAFVDWTPSPREADRFIGLANFKYWFVGEGSELFYFSLKQTLLYGMVVVPLDVICGLGFALVMNESLPARPLFRGIALTGYASPTIAAGLVWALMADANQYGLLYNTLQFFFDVPTAGGLTSNVPWAFWTLVIAQVWRDFGFMYLILLAGLQSIPDSLYEMSRVDGAGPVQRFRYITLPHVSTVLVTVVMIRMVYTVGEIDMLVAVTQGGPVNFTTLLALLVFEKAFQEYVMGKAAALGLMFVVALIPLIFIYIRYETAEYKQ